MEQVWRQGQATVRDVLDRLNRGRKKRAYTTIMTIMARLYRKGLLTRVRRGYADVYSAALSKDEYLNARAEADVEALFKQYGELAAVHFMGRMEKLDPERVEALRRLARGE
jgi:predicted transcriptional regulator